MSVPAALLLVGAGEFGARVVRLLGRDPARRRRIVALDDLEHAAGLGPAALVLAVGRPAPALCRRMDALALAVGSPWLPILAEPSHLRVGPWLGSPGGPCFECYHTRRLQHDTQREVTRLVHRALDGLTDFDSFGHLPQHGRLAAGLAEVFLADAQDAARPPARDQVLSVRTDTGRISANHVVPCHTCARCTDAARSGEPSRSRVADAVARLRERERGLHAGV